MKLKVVICDILEVWVEVEGGFNILLYILGFILLNM